MPKGVYRRRKPTKVIINSMHFKHLLHSKNINLIDLSDEKSDYYCGYSRRTISHCMSTNSMTKPMYTAIKKAIAGIVDIDECVISKPNEVEFLIDRIDALEKEMREVRKLLFFLQANTQTIQYANETYLLIKRTSKDPIGPVELDYLFDKLLQYESK